MRHFDIRGAGVTVAQTGHRGAMARLKSRSTTIAVSDFVGNLARVAEVAGRWFAADRFAGCWRCRDDACCWPGGTRAEKVGALLGFRARDTRQRGARVSWPQMSKHCLNCETPVGGNYCPTCGQSVRERRGPLFGILGDFLTEFLSLDGRHLRTLVGLLIPGKLTQLHLAGKHATYATPVRVYVVASLAFFLLVGFPVPDAANVNLYVNDILIERDEPAPGLAKLELATFDRTSRLGQRMAPFFDARIEVLRAMPAQVLLDKFFAGLERTVPTALIVLVPFIAIGLTALYFRQPFFYVDHLVFALHVQSFLFLLFVLARFANMLVLGRVLAGALTYVAAALLLLPVYLLLAIRRVYAQSWLMTAVKCGVLCVFYLIIVQPILLITMFLVIQRM